MPPGSYRPVFICDSQRQASDQAAQAEADRKLPQESDALQIESSYTSPGIDITSESLDAIPDSLLNSEGIRWMHAALVGAGLII